MTEETKPVQESEDSLFDEDNVSEELPTMEEAPSEEQEESWAPTVSSESPKERLERKGVKTNADGRTLTIKEVFFTRPRQKDMQGAFIPPSLTQTTKKPFYGAKLGIKFEEENIVEYYPTMRYFVNDGIMSKSAKLNRTGKSEIKKITDLVIAKLGKSTEEVSDQAILNYLVGKQVKIEVETGVYNNKPWFRNNIIEIL